MALYKGSEPVSGLAKNIVVNGFHLFDFKWSDKKLNDMSWVESTSFTWHDGNVYTDAYNKLVEEYSNATQEEQSSHGFTFKISPNGFQIATVEAEEGILNKYDTFGVTWFYILDTENKRFKLPRTKWGFKGLRTNASKDIGESLPNIRGTFDTGDRRTHIRGTSGALYNNTIASGQWGGTSEAQGNTQGVGFDASRSSSTYQDGAPVQERGTQMYLYFYVGEYSQTAIEQTAGITSEQLNNKADVSTTNNLETNKMNRDFSNAQNLANINPMITSYVNGTSGYNIWANGYCEQWGRTAVIADYATATISLIKKYMNTDYLILQSGMIPSTGDDASWNGASVIRYATRTTNSFQIYNRGASDGGRYFNWRTSGYLAEGQY